MSDARRLIEDGAKKRETLNFSMANYGVDIVEKGATHVNKDWKETRKEEKTQQT